MTEFKEPVLWGHQEKGFKLAVNKSEFGFIFDCGTGKSLTVIKTLRYKFAFHKRMLKTLIISPKITLENWKDEWLKFSRIEEKYILVLDGPVEKRIEKFIRALETIGQNLIVITNYDGPIMNKGVKREKVIDPVSGLTKYKYVKPLKQSASDKFFQALMQWKPEVLVCDESHRCADGQSKRTKTMKKLSSVTMYRYIMTGTFMPNDEIDVFAQFLILDRGQTFGENFMAFRAHYFYNATPNSIAPKWILQPHLKEEFNAKVASKTMSAKKEDCIDLPELVEKMQLVYLEGEQLRLYNEMREEMITYLEDEAVVAEIAITKMLRLNQICSGFVKTDSGEIIRIKNGAKEVALLDMLEDLRGQKIIIWAVFHEDYDIIREVCNKLKIPCCEAHGKTKNNIETVRMFDQDWKEGVIIGHPRAIGEGINIKSAGVRFYYDRTYSYVEREQSETRNFRGGSIDYHDKILSIDLTAKGTVDETTIKVVKNKWTKNRDIIEAIKQALRA